MHIAPYKFAIGFGSHDPDRRRKLLLHRAEVERLQSRVAQERLALVPLRLYFSDGRAKIELAVARGRQKADKRQAIAERDSQREIERALGRHRKGSTDPERPQSGRNPSLGAERPGTTRSRPDRPLARFAPRCQPR